MQPTCLGIFLFFPLIDSKDDEYVSRVAHAEKEACQLVEAGFDYICDFNGNNIFQEIEVKGPRVFLWRAGWDSNPQQVEISRVSRRLVLRKS